MGTCWLLGAKTRLDLGWNLSAAADKGAGFCTRPWGQRGGARFTRDKRREGGGGKVSEKSASAPATAAPAPEIWDSPFTNTRGPPEQRGREATLCNGAIVGSWSEGSFQQSFQIAPSRQRQGGWVEEEEEWLSARPKEAEKCATADHTRGSEPPS